jgi:hypothetical protein
MTHVIQALALAALLCIGVPTAAETRIRDAVSEWTSGPALPVGLSETTAALLDSKLYVFGGNNKATLVFDLQTQQWAPPGTLKERPHPGDHQTVHVYNRRLYVVAGVGFSAHSKIQVYDVDSDQWLSNIVIPWTVHGSVNSYLVGSSIIICGGLQTATCGTFSIPAGTFSMAMPNMPLGVNHAGFGSTSSHLYVFGGRTGGNVPAIGESLVQRFSLTSNTWATSSQAGVTNLPALPQARGGQGASVYANGELYVIGGETTASPGPANGVYSRVDIFNPATGTWRRGPDLPQGMHGIYPVLDPVSNTIYIAGGGVRVGASSSKLLLKLNLGPATSPPSPPPSTQPPQPSTLAPTVAPTVATTVPPTQAPTLATPIAPANSCAYFGCKVFKSSNPCHCDSLCQKYNDCCPDYVSQCSSGGGSTQAPTPTPLPPTTKPLTPAPTQAPIGCVAFGCGTYKSSNPCQCDPNCAKYADCCSDFAATCSGSASLPTTKPPAPAPKPNSNSCSTYGCGGYKSGQSCQCDSACAVYGDCCSDKTAVCK